MILHASIRSKIYWNELDLIPGKDVQDIGLEMKTGQKALEEKREKERERGSVSEKLT